MHPARRLFTALVLSSLTLVAGAQTELAKLKAAQAASGDEFGTSIATKGTLTVIGAPYHMVGQNIQQGAAYVYDQPSTGWKNTTQSATLTASDGAPYDAFGYAVAFDSGTVVVGAPTRALTSDHGAVYVFVKSGPTYKQVAKLTPSDGFAGDAFGSSVAMKGDTIVVGDRFATSNGVNTAGATYVFLEPSTGWTDATENARLTTSDPVTSGNVGYSLSFNGTTLVVGAPGAGSIYHGEAYVYVKPVTGWTDSIETAKLVASDPMVNGFFGNSVSLSGNTVLVGSPGSGAYNRNYGAGYIFVKPATGWTNATQTAKLTASTGHAYDSLGTSVSLVGGTALMGAPGVWYGTSAGKAYIYTKPAGGWQSTSSFQTELKAKDRQPTDQFGFAVALNGNLNFVGAISSHYQSGIEGPGAAYVFGP